MVAYGKKCREDGECSSGICEMTYDESLPTPYGVIYQESKPSYDELVNKQIEDQIKLKGTGKLKDLIYTKNTWDIS